MHLLSDYEQTFENYIAKARTSVIQDIVGRAHIFLAFILAPMTDQVSIAILFPYFPSIQCIT